MVAARTNMYTLQCKIPTKNASDNAAGRGVDKEPPDLSEMTDTKQMSKSMMSPSVERVGVNSSKSSIHLAPPSLVHASTSNLQT